MSMYGNYIKERLGDEIVETEKGFATYRFVELNSVPAVYLVDIYVNPDFRKENVASDLADVVVKMALRVGCKLLIGTIVPSSKNSTVSLKVLLGYGMTLFSASNDLIVFKKEI